MFIETPSSYSFPSPHPPKESLDTEDQLCVTLRKASLEKPLPKDKVQDQYRPYVILGGFPIEIETKISKLITYT